MINDKYLYFRTQADQDNDDGIDDSLYLPARTITAIVPTSATAITIFFESMYNTFANVAEDLNVISDSVIINCTAGKVRQVMEHLVRAINSNKLYGDGIIVVADDVTTTYLTSSASADETVVGKYLHPAISACGATTVATVLSE